MEFRYSRTTSPNHRTWSPRPSIWLVSHEETNKGARIRTVIDYVREQFRQDEREWFSTTPRSRSMAAA